MSGPVQTLEICKSNCLGRKVANIQADCFHQDARSRFHTLNKHKPFLLPFLSFTLSLARNDNTNIYIFQAIAKEGNLSDCCICHQNLWSVHDARDSLGFPVTNYSSILIVTTNYSWLPLEGTYRVQLLQPEYLVFVFTFLHVWLYLSN